MDPLLETITELLEEVRALRADLRATTGAVLNREQAAAYLGISVRNLHDQVKRGKLKRVKMSSGRYGFRRDALDAFLGENEDYHVDEDERWYQESVKA